MKKILFLFVIYFIVILLAEILFTQYINRVYFKNEIRYRSWTEKIRYRFKKSPYENIKVNELGFLYDKKWNIGDKNIIFIGDSVVEYLYKTKILEEYFKGYQVFNCGVRGYNTDQQLYTVKELMKKNIINSNTKKIYFFVNINDWQRAFEITNSGYLFYTNINDPDILTLAKKKSNLFLGFYLIFSKVKQINFIKNFSSSISDRVKKIFEKKNSIKVSETQIKKFDEKKNNIMLSFENKEKSFEIFAIDKNPDLKEFCRFIKTKYINFQSEHYETMIKSLYAIIILLKKEKIDFAFVKVPYHAEFQKPDRIFNEPYMIEWLEDLTYAYDVEYIDPTIEFKKYLKNLEKIDTYETNIYKLFEDNNHPNLEGQKIILNLIQACLNKHNL